MRQSENVVAVIFRNTDGTNKNNDCFQVQAIAESARKESVAERTSRRLKHRVVNNYLHADTRIDTRL